MEDAIAALLGQRSVEDAARTVGISTRTLIRWMKQPEFDAAYRQARRDAFAQATARLQQASGTAVSVLVKVMIDGSAPAASRVRAADCILGHASKAIELEDIEARLAELERSVEERTK